MSQRVRSFLSLVNQLGLVVTHKHLKSETANVFCEQARRTISRRLPLETHISVCVPNGNMVDRRWQQISARHRILPLTVSAFVAKQDR